MDIKGRFRNWLSYQEISNLGNLCTNTPTHSTVIYGTLLVSLLGNNLCGMMAFAFRPVLFEVIIGFMTTLHI